MRYTLRLLTLDQLSRAAGVVCALELMRTGEDFLDKRGRKMLGEWPIEIGLWVGSDASPNRLGGTGDTGDDTAVTRVRKYKAAKEKPRRHLKPVHGAGRNSTRIPSSACQTIRVRPICRYAASTRLAILHGGRPLPILTVDQPIYRRLPAFLIATVDKFAALPWVGESGAFFGNVDRHENKDFTVRARGADNLSIMAGSLILLT